MMQSKYVGSELEIFADAVQWRSYWAGIVRPHLGTEVLEVGAGIGSVTRILGSSDNSWTALEPDAEMVGNLEKEKFSSKTKAICGTIDDLTEGETFDTVLYIDVLEHIEDDKKEIGKAAGRLRPGGKIVVLAPAHNFLFSPFDTEVGHFRRYSLKSLEALCPAGFSKNRGLYLDSLGVLASVANKLLLRQGRPTARQIRFWDRCLVPISRVFDPLLSHRVGKTVLAIWAKPAGGIEG